MDLVQLIESTTGGYNEGIIEDIDIPSIPEEKPKPKPTKAKKSLDDIVVEKVTGLDKIVKTE